MSPAFGTDPLDVTIYDTSIGDPATWEWTIESPDKTPEKVYQRDLTGQYQFGAGTHRVTLTVGNAYGSMSRTRTVTVLPADTTEPQFQCPYGCHCNEPDVPGTERCSDTPCATVNGVNYYCSGQIPMTSCTGDCECRTDTDAIQRFGNPTHVPVRCSSEPCKSAGGVSSYCYHRGTFTCPAGYRCMQPTTATYQFITPKKASETVCGYDAEPDTQAARIPKYCYGEGHVVS